MLLVCKKEKIRKLSVKIVEVQRWDIVAEFSTLPWLQQVLILNSAVNMEGRLKQPCLQQPSWQVTRNNSNHRDPNKKTLQAQTMWFHQLGFAELFMGMRWFVLKDIREEFSGFKWGSGDNSWIYGNLSSCLNLVQPSFP